MREAVSKAKAKFPPDALEPTITEINLSLFPIISILLYGDADQRVQLAAAQQIQDALQSIPEVLSANIVGDRDKQVEILMSPEKMEALNIRADQLLQSLAQSNLLVAAGTLSDGSGSYAVRVPGLISNADELYQLPIKSVGDRVVTLKDVADIRYNFVSSVSASFVNGKPSLTIQVVKRSGENMLSTIGKVRIVVDEAKKQLPAGLNIGIEGDRSVQVNDLLKDLTNNVVSAVLLVIAVVMGFLGFRSGLLVGVSVPGSFLGGILAIYLSGLTINIVVLFALILSVGMLVDDAIIVCEYAARRIEQGMSKKLAYREASTRMAFPIITATLTKIVVFLPLLFWPGIVGQFMRYMPLTLIAVLGASLVFALLFLPVLGTELEKVKRIFIYIGCLVFLAVLGGLVLKTIGVLLALVGGVVGLSYYTRRESYRAKIIAEETLEKEKEKIELGEMVEEMPQDKWHQYYVAALSAIVKKPVTGIMVSVGLLMMVFMMYGKLSKGVDFFPDTEPEQFSLAISARGNLSIQDKINMVKQVEDKVVDYKNRYGGIAVVNSLIGKQNNEGNQAAIDEIGQVVVEMNNWKTRPSVNYVLGNLLKSTSDIPGILVRTKKEQNGPKAAKPINLEIYGDNPEKLRAAVIKTKQQMETGGRMIEITDDLPPPSINWQLKVDRGEASRYGANVALVGTFVKLVTQGVKIGSINTNDSKKQVDIIARYPEAYRGLSGLDRIKVNTQNGSVPLSYFVDRQAVLDDGTINRTDQKQAHAITANVRPGVVPTNEIKIMEAWLKTNLPSGVTYAFTGDQQNQKESMVFLASAFAVAIFMIAAIMLLEFNSFSTCLFILTAVIMSTAGVLIGLIIMQQPFIVVMTGLGIISLAGIIVNNNIVLIDTYDHHRRAGIEPIEAVILAGAQRLRPVFLTSLCTVLGLLPIVFAINIDFVGRAIDIGGPSSQLWVGLATAIAFGMIFATPFTLLITPCMLIARERYFGHIPVPQNKHRISNFLTGLVNRFGGR